jgi:hypothetical protein
MDGVVLSGLVKHQRQFYLLYFTEVTCKQSVIKHFEDGPYNGATSLAVGRFVVFSTAIRKFL